MRRTLIASLALLGAAPSAGWAQTCMGLASFSTAPMQITARSQFSALAHTFGASAGYGMPSSIYGQAGISTTSNDGPRP